MPPGSREGHSQLASTTHGIELYSHQSMVSDPLVAVDLFAGAGGLTLGAIRAGFDVRVAVEIDPDTCLTYRTNHPSTTLLERDARTLSGQDLLGLLRGKRPDLLMAGTPCQGFSSLTVKSAQEDPRNQLINDLARLVDEARPATVFMENVPGLASRGKQVFDSLLQRLKDAGYEVQWWNVQMADYGVPQRRRRLVLLAGRGFSINLPHPTHTRSPTTPDLLPWNTVRATLVAADPPCTLAAARKTGGPRAYDWHIVRDLRPETKKRLQAATPGSLRFDLDDSLLPNCHRNGYTGYRNVYMRMQWDAPAPTITAGCTTPAKGRFGHPDPQRTTISVREAASLQTFPKTFRLATDKIDVACSLIGNAVPPRFAEAMIRHIATTIRTHAPTTSPPA